MARFVSDDRYRDLAYGSGRRAHRTASAGSLIDYRFGRVRSKSTYGPLHRINGALRHMIEAIVDSKLRRMERELELLGILARDNR
jgi:hypothetical protein